MYVTGKSRDCTNRGRGVEEPGLGTASATGLSSSSSSLTPPSILGSIDEVSKEIKPPLGRIGVSPDTATTGSMHAGMHQLRSYSIYNGEDDSSSQAANVGGPRECSKTTADRRQRNWEGKHLVWGSYRTNSQSLS